MTVFGSNRPHAAITDMRIRLMEDRDRIVAELARDVWTPEQRLTLIRELNFANGELVKMQLLSSKKWKIRRENGKINRKNKGGRLKRLYDSAGEPLYQGVPAREPEDQKESFLKTLRSDESPKTEEPTS